MSWSAEWHVIVAVSEKGLVWRSTPRSSSSSRCSCFYDDGFSGCGWVTMTTASVFPAVCLASWYFSLSLVSRVISYVESLWTLSCFLLGPTLGVEYLMRFGHT